VKRVHGGRGGRLALAWAAAGLTGLTPATARTQPAPPHTATASVAVLSDSFPVPQLGRTRRVWLYLPPGYATSGRRYPVLYLQDGQNVFDAATSFAGEWGVDESLDSLAARGDPGAIVVAVDNGGAHRVDEYDPWRDPRYGGGEGDAYVAFLAETLKPYVDAHYRTLADPAHTGVLGSSLGGLIALYAALRRPDVFGRAGVFSCAAWIARDSLLAFVRRSRPAGERIYFVVGGRETDDGSQPRDQALVVDALRAAGFAFGTAVDAEVRPDGEHREWFWRREFPAAYLWLFPPQRGRRSPPTR
jgi:metallo-beta-lactamase class B